MNADGGTANSGGAGGSIWIDGGVLQGLGSISANGGDGNTWRTYNNNASGGGGRIRISGQSYNFQGGAAALGGIINSQGAAGTVYVVDAGVSRLVIDNAGATGQHIAYDYFALTEAPGPITVDYLEIRNGGILGTAILSTLDISVRHDMTIGNGGRVNIDYKGFGTNAGPHHGDESPCGFPGFYANSGGGHGGIGGGTPCFSGTGPYGSLELPTTFGSGGGSSGAAGGAAHIVVGGALIIDGPLTANGDRGYGYCLSAGGGASGGSILVFADTVAGSSRIEARGGAGSTAGCSLAPAPGGGAGGRVAIHSNQMLLPVNSIDISGGQPTVVGGGQDPPDSGGQSGGEDRRSTVDHRPKSRRMKAEAAKHICRRECLPRAR